jgi:hypothetical protein
VWPTARCFASCGSARLSRGRRVGRGEEACCCGRRVRRCVQRGRSRAAARPARSGRCASWSPNRCTGSTSRAGSGPSPVLDCPRVITASRVLPSVVILSAIASLVSWSAPSSRGLGTARRTRGGCARQRRQNRRSWLRPLRRGAPPPLPRGDARGRRAARPVHRRSARPARRAARRAHGQAAVAGRRSRGRHRGPSGSAGCSPSPRGHRRRRVMWPSCCCTSLQSSAVPPPPAKSTAVGLPDPRQ